MDFPNQPQVDVEIEISDPDLAKQRDQDRLQAFGSGLSQQRDEWIRSRASYGVDKRWLDDEDQYNAVDNVNRAASQMMTSVEQGYPVTVNYSKPHRSTVFIGMTRQKTNSAEARLSDILLPTDDRNWGIQPTPNPKLMGMTKSEQPAVDPATGQQMADPKTGQPMMHKDIARNMMEIARDKADAMQRAIDDQLVESEYNGEIRKLMHDAAVLGADIVTAAFGVYRDSFAHPFTDYGIGVFTEAWNKTDTTGV